MEINELNNRPTVKVMLKEAAESFDGRVKKSDLRDYIQKKYGDVKTSTINAHIRMCTVNNPSRIHWDRNKKPRVANENIDFLFNVDKGVVELYDPKKHGTWDLLYLICLRTALFSNKFFQMETIVM